VGLNKGENETQDFRSRFSASAFLERCQGELLKPHHLDLAEIHGPSAAHAEHGRRAIAKPTRALTRKYQDDRV